MSMRKVLIMIFILSLFNTLGVYTASAIEVAPRISDKEIVERLSRLEEGQKKLESRIDDLRSEMNSRFESIDKRFESIDKRFESIDKRFDDLRSEMNSRFDILTWIFGLFITISTITLGFVIRMQFQMQNRQSQVETSLETQKDELRFLKDLIGKLLPPKSAL